MVKSESSKCLKASNGNCGGIDRITNLPEHLISHILSFLPTTSAVATSVLSTRWKFLWTSITNLHFDSYEHIFKSKREPRVQSNMFTQFVNRGLLLLNPSSIQKFDLTCHQGHFDPYYLDSWISFALTRTVGYLNMYVELGEPMDLPLRHMIYCNVVDLMLQGDIHFNIPAAASVCLPSLHTLYLNGSTAIASDSSLSFPNLKKLHLDCVQYANEDSVHKLFSSCPVLVDLIIERDDWDDVDCLIIRIPSLTSLRLAFKFRDSDYFFACKLQLDTPALQYLDLEDDLPCEYLPAENLSSLLQAKVKLDLIDENDVESYISISKLIGSLSKVKSLSISGKTLKAIRVASVLPGFHNLTRLELEGHDCVELSRVINNFLESMDNLEHLVIKGNSCNCWEQSWFTEPLNVPKCLLSRVTTISFTYMINDCCDQLALIRYFLKNAEVLQLLRISSCSKRNFELLQKISMFPRGSRTCQVAFT